MDKKQFFLDIEAKLNSTFGHLAKGGDKKFTKLIKKASDLLADGLHKVESKPKNKKAKAKKKKDVPAKAQVKKKAIVKKK